MKTVLFVKPSLLIMGCILLFGGCTQKTPVDYVNPYMGNVSHLLVPCFPTVSLPNGMMRVYPNRADFATSTMNGLPVTVPEHRGTSPISFNPTQNANPRAVTSYSYDLEHITPYSWDVYLDNEKIDVSYAPAYQSAVYNFNFNAGDDAKLVITSRNGEVTLNEDNSVNAYARMASGTRLYTYVEAEQPVKSDSRVGNSVVLHFGDAKDVRIRYGISFVSAEQAKKNLHKEISDYDTQALADKGRKIWNEALGKIKVEGGREQDKVVFYTSLYRTYERMINITEDGKYWSAYDQQVHDDEGSPFYIDDWSWDTYRAVHPLRILIEPEKELYMLRSYLRIAQQNPEKWMPTFPGVAGENHSMNSNHAVSFFTDAYAKGITDFDMAEAFRAGYAVIHEKSLIPHSYQPAMELDEFFHKNGYFPAIPDTATEIYKQVNPTEYRQPVPVTLGTSFDFWCLAKMAKILGKDAEYEYCLKRSLDYRNLFNKETGFFHPKDEFGVFIPDVDYSWSGGQGGRYYYDENNGWIYRWDVQHNIADLVSLMGGPEKFAQGLDDMFDTPIKQSKWEFFRKFPDHTGLLGQYSAANEPSTHIPYLYNYAGQPWKTQKHTRRIIDTYYRDDVMGVPGDEDGGGMSSFVVFTQLGFYPVTPGLPMYNIGSPVFTKSVIDLGNGKSFTIEAPNCSYDNKYIQSATLNGKAWDKPWFNHSDIINGGRLVLKMGPKPNENWGSDLSNIPPSYE